MKRSGTINTIHEVSAQGKSIHAIARELGIARNTVRKYLRGAPQAIPRPKRGSVLDPYKTQIQSFMQEFTTLSGFAEDLASVPHACLRRQRLRRYLTPRVLVIDEIGYTKLTTEQAQSFFELVRDRYERGPNILTSNTGKARMGQAPGR